MNLINRLPNYFLPLAIIICALTLAVYWSFLVPILQSPDEPTHSDYVFSLYARGRLIRAGEGIDGGFSHPNIPYLLNATDGKRMFFHPFIKVSSNYGTKKFFSQMDKEAPTDSYSGTNPFMLAVYPFGYYGITALWLGLISHFSKSLSFLFFSARLFSVLLLGVGLIFSFLTMIELGLSRDRATLILAAIAFFPLTSFVGSYIQPDNLSFAAASACFYFALRWRNSLNDKNILSLALSMTILLLSKYQFFFCISLAILAMIIARAIRSGIGWKKLAFILASLVLPAALAASVQSYIWWGSKLAAGTYIVDSKHLVEAFHSNWRALLAHVVNAFYDQYQTLYLANGQTFVSFWGKFGWLDTPLVIANQALTDLITGIIQLATTIILLLTILTLVKITINIIILGKRKHLSLALYLACSNPVINSYFLFVIFMFVFNIAFYPSFFGQGRHWFPLILPLVLSAVCVASRIFSKKIRTVLFFTITAGWLLYSLLGNYYAIGCIHKRYYEPEAVVTINLPALKHSQEPNGAAILHCDFFDFDKIHANTLMMPKGSEIDISGWAVDLQNHSPGRAVLLYIDDNEVCQPMYGLANNYAIEKFHDCRYRLSGFAALIPTKDLNLGWHSLCVKVVSNDGSILYDTKAVVHILLIAQ